MVSSFYLDFLGFILTQEGMVFLSGWIVAWITIILAIIIIKIQHKRAFDDRTYFRDRHHELERTMTEVIKGVTESLTKVSERFTTLEMLLLQVLGKKNGSGN